MIHYFLDLDNTVTESRGRIDPDMYKVLAPLDVTIISGASEKQMRAQVDTLPCTLMSQNGNVNPLWSRFLTKVEHNLILDHIHLYAQPTENQIEDRGAQISYSFVGHHAPIEKKKAFDPGGTYRADVLAEYPVNSVIEARIGGTTCIDYFPKGLNKGTNIDRYIKEMGWNKRDCIYIGDALFPGGNDETVIGIIPTYPVKNWKGTYNFFV